MSDSEVKSANDLAPVWSVFSKNDQEEIERDGNT
jgi:hypothetical protein